MTNEAVAARPPASGVGNQDRIGSEALARGLLLMRASAINVVRLQLAMERRDRKVALRTVDELMQLDRRIDDFLGDLPMAEDGISAEREALDEQGRALSREKLVLAAGRRGPELKSEGVWDEAHAPPDRPNTPSEALAEAVDSVLELTVEAQPSRFSLGTRILVGLIVLLAVLAGLSAFVLLNPTGPGLPVPPLNGVSS